MKTKFDCPRTCAYKQRCQFSAIFTALGKTKVYSHITKVDIEIRDLDALATAAKNLGLELRRGQKTYKWYGRSVGDYPLPAGMTEKDLGKCSHAVSIPGNSRAYEIGLVDNHDGSFRPVWDFWSGGRELQEKVGEGCSKLIGAYTIEAARNAAMAQQWMTADNADGTLTIYHPESGTITVHRDGTVDSNGFIGQGCNAASAIENAIGKTKDTVYKAEYYAEKARVTN